MRERVVYELYTVNKPAASMNDMELCQRGKSSKEAALNPLARQAEIFGDAIRQPLIEDIMKKLPVYHTRTMRIAMFENFGLNIKKSALRHFYRDLTGDQAISSSWYELRDYVQCLS